MYDLIVIGSGAAGIIASIKAARDGKRVLLLEKLSSLGPKLKATGGGRCNLTNTLENEDFMKSFGRNGKFMRDALYEFDSNDLIAFFKKLGVDTHAPDGFHIFPTTHNSTTIIKGLEAELKRLNVTVMFNQNVQNIFIEDNRVQGVQTQSGKYHSENVLIATGGQGYPTLGTTGDGYEMAQDLGHKVSELYPAMLPLLTEEKWVANCRADTIAKATMKIDLPKYKKVQAVGDLIFTNSGIRGPVVLDFAREITPLVAKLGKVPIVVNFSQLNEEQLREHFKKYSELSILKTLQKLFPQSFIIEICKIVNIDETSNITRYSGQIRDEFFKLLTWTPLTIIGSDGFEKAMVTRGGVSLKEVDPKSMKSKIIDGLYFAGEVLDLDGPCGGYNLQWSFSSGYLAGKLMV